ncbi:hypothetical protein ACA910_015305 [Epithemia clementina (nom. ined.)]
MTKPPTFAPSTKAPTFTPTSMSTTSKTVAGDLGQDYSGEVALNANEKETCSWLSSKIGTNQNDFGFYCAFWDIARFCPRRCDSCDLYNEELNQETILYDRYLQGTIRYDGNIFTLQAKREIVVQGFDLHLFNDTNYSYGVKVYTRASPQEYWQLMCDSTLTSLGPYHLTRVPGYDCTAVSLHPEQSARII